MNPYALPPLITDVLILLIGIFVVAYRRTKVNLFFSLFCLSLFVWLAGFSTMYLSKDPNSGLKFARIGFYGVIFIPITAYHFIRSFLDLRNNLLLKIAYCLSIPSILIVQTPLIYKGIRRCFFGFYPIGGKIYILFPAMFFVLMFHGVVILYRSLKNPRITFTKKQQIKYVLFAIGITGVGIVDYISKFPPLTIYPFAYVCCLGMVLFISYAILKHQLMDIRIAITKVAILLTIYTVMLGFPFWIGYKTNSWIISTAVCAILASLGPLIYRFLQREIVVRLEQKLHLYVADEQIRRQQALDHFSASMAHEIDNPVYAAMGIAQMTQRAIQDDYQKNMPKEAVDYINDRLSRIVKDIGRVSKMIKAIREFSGQTKGEFSEIEFDEVIDTFQEIALPQFKHEGIEFKLDKDDNIKLQGNKIYLEEVLMNLALNAIHAVKHNNKPEKLISLSIKRKDNKTILITMTDNGYGIKPNMLEDIFLDFVTTKASTEGTGMGLSRVRKIAQLHGGKTWAESDGLGKGAKFFVELVG